MPSAETPTNLHQIGASDALARFRALTLRPSELMRALLSRIAAYNGALNALVAMPDADSLLAAAAKADARYAQGTPLGPLDGLPISVKDNLWVAGLPATWGLQALADFIPDTDDDAVTVLREAGAIILGKTNVPAMALAAVTQNAVYGATLNPLDTTCTPGGSSGGAAAGVAAELFPLALVTDAGGSIRRPAAYTGTTGYKPSTGAWIGSSGFPRTSLDFQVLGPIARNVEDCALLASVLALDPRLHALGSPAARPAESLRQAIAPARILAVEPPSSGQEPAISAALSRSADLLASAGHQVRWGQLPYSVEQVDEFWSLLIALGVRAGAEELDLAADQLPANLQPLLARGQALNALDSYGLACRLLAWRERQRTLWSGTDYLLMPASPCFAWPSDQPFPATIAGLPAGVRAGALYATYANASGSPALSIPVPGATPAIGLQLVAAPGADLELLRLGWQLEHLLA